MGKPYTIAVIGLWHLGEVYSACLAELGHTVKGISDDLAVIENFKKNIPPLGEPRLAELIEKRQKEGVLTYTADWSAVKDADVVWFTYDTPVDDKEEVDISIVRDALAKALPHFKEGVLVAMSSQLPVGTSSEFCASIKKMRPELSFSYVYTPENLRLGDAVRIFMEPGRIVVGTDSSDALEAMKFIFAKLNAEILLMSPASAEMAKHAMNAWNATCISFTNDLADLCEATGADVEDVIKALKTDSRVGPKAYLFAGLGFSGGTLGRDLKAMLKAGRNTNIELPMITAAYAKNASRDEIVPARLQKLFGSISGKTIALFGVTYKAGTSTLRRSQPLAIEARLRAAGALLRLYDPLAIPEEVAAVTPSPFFRDPYEAANGADIALVMTPSPDYRNLDFAKLKSVMKQPVLFDTCNILPTVEEKIVSAGLSYMRIGR